MNIQLPPNSRTSDPESSHMAGEALTDSGVRLTNCDVVLAKVIKLNYWYPYSYTGHEISETIEEFDYHEVMRRLNDLAHKELVTKVKDEHDKPILRKCSVSKRASCTWVLP